MNDDELERNSRYVFLLMIGIIMLVKPEWMWKLKHGLSVQDGEPTDLYLVSTRIIGTIILVTVGSALIYTLLP